MRLGRYVLMDRLATGGMAEVFLARAEGEAGFARICVVKRILPHLSEDPAFVQMFLDEARLAARLHHPGIVQIFELGRASNDYFFAMEYLAGENWATLIAECNRRANPVPVPVALRLARFAADALHYAHEAADEKGASLNVIHRDVSPANLFVTYQGEVKVLDFGIARAVTSSSRTETGHVKGKTRYMAPEQALGQSVDRRVDVWALGVCLHELLCGRPLFRGETTAEVALNVCQGRIPSPSSVRSDLPNFIDALVMKALRREVGQRYANAAAFRDALDAALAALPRGGQVDLAAFLVKTMGPQQREARLRVLSLPTPAPGGNATAAIAIETRRPRFGAWKAGVGAVALALLTVAIWIARQRSPSAPGMPSRPAVPSALAEPSAPVARIEVGPVSTSRSVAPPGPSSAPSPAPDVPVPPPTSNPLAPKRIDAERATGAAARARGAITLVAQPYARVRWNGSDLGTTPLFGVTLPAGSQTLHLTGPDGQHRRLKVFVAKGAVTTLRIQLDHLAKE